MSAGPVAHLSPGDEIEITATATAGVYDGDELVTRAIVEGVEDDGTVVYRLDADAPRTARVTPDGDVVGAGGERHARDATIERAYGGRRTSITAYADEVEVLDRARRQLSAERDESLALHEALVLLAERYLAGGD